MKNNRLTLQKSLAITILLIGVIGIVLVFATDYTYRQLAYEQQKDAVNNLISIKSADLIEKLTNRQKDLGFRLQSETGFVNKLGDGIQSHIFAANCIGRMRYGR